MKANRRKDILTAIIFLVIGIFAIFVLIPIGVTVPGSVKVAALSPDFWPRIISIGAVVAAIFLFIETMAMQQPSFEEFEAEEDAQYKLDTMPGNLRAVAIVVAMFVFYASLTTAGVVVASIILMFIMMLFFGEQKLWLVAVLSFSVPIILYLFFRYVASVPIPLGIFGN